MKSKRSFWKELPSPFWSLAPMEDVTDTVFRQIVISCGRPHVLFTEFTSVEGLDSEGKEKVSYRLKYRENEHPIVAQIWGTTPEAHFKAACLIRELGFDGVDINMGCPVKKIVKQGACSALIENHELTKEIVVATKEGAKNLPVSVKTRIGFKRRVTKEWAGFLLSLGLDALTIHGRIAAEMSKTPANWEEIGKVVRLRNQMGVDTPIVGNGDVMNLLQAQELVYKYRVDGIMFGRAIFKNPWLFNSAVNIEDIGVSTKLDLLKKHVLMFEETWGCLKNFDLMKKFFKVYVNDFAGASDLRNSLMNCENVKEVITFVDLYTKG